MGRKPQTLSTDELISSISEGLRNLQYRPTIHAYKPQDQQLPFHESQAVGRLGLGGNRSGKTVAAAAELVMKMTGLNGPHKFNPPVKCRAIGVDFDNGVDKIIIPEVKRWMPPTFLKNGSWEDSYKAATRTLTLNNGSTCEFMSYDQDVDKFAGTSRHYIYFDEEPPEAIFNECLLRLVDTGGQWWMAMTPLIDMSWTLDRLYEPAINGTNPYIEVFMFETSENPHLVTENIDIYTTGMSDEEKEARKKGTFFTYSGAIYANVISGAILEPIVGTKAWPQIKEEWMHFGMLDVGFTNPTAYYLGAEDREGRIIIYAEYYKSGRVVRDNAKGILELERELGIDPEYRVSDPAIRNTDPIVGISLQAAYANEGVYLALGNNDVLAGIERVYSRFKNKRLFITKDCEKAIEEHKKYRWAKYVNKKVEARNNPQEKPMKKNDHSCDSIRYGIASRPSVADEIDMRPPVGFNGSIALPPNGIRYADSYRDEFYEKTMIDPHLGEDY